MLELSKSHELIQKIDNKESWSLKRQETQLWDETIYYLNIKINFSIEREKDGGNQSCFHNIQL